MRLGALFVCLACVGTRLPWALDEAMEPVEKQFRQSAVYKKSDRAAGPLCADVIAFVLGYVEEGGVIGAGLAGDEIAF